MGHGIFVCNEMLLLLLSPATRFLSLATYFLSLATQFLSPATHFLSQATLLLQISFPVHSRHGSRRCIG